MTTYNYSKNIVVKKALFFEINNSSISSADLINITWESPDNLNIIFSGDLSVSDKEVLKTLVENHEGTCNGLCPTTIMSNYSPNGSEWNTYIDDDGVLQTFLKT